MAGLDLPTLIARAIVLLIAFTVHELAHAVTADRLGDPTPRRMGRITLNPLAHLDPIGTIMLLLVGFGWAKPVMVNPMNMRGNPRTSMAIVAIAGPISNILMALAGALVFRLGLVDFTFNSTLEFLPSPAFLLSEFVWINLILAFFNLIPIPPLDGSKILYAFLPSEWVYRIQPLERFGFLILFGLVYLVPTFINTLVVAPSLAILQFLIGVG
jgi:Zn-dependent protease